MSVHSSTALPTGSALADIAARVAEIWPEHAVFLEQRFAGESHEQLDAAEAVARRIAVLAAGRLDEVIAGYRWACRRLTGEQLFFRRHGRYRFTTVDQVRESGILDDPYMTYYQHGLLLSHILWTNHARVGEVYQSEFLGRRGDRDRLLEVGPGHGLLLSLAAEHVRGEVAGWDISESALRHTRHNLEALGVHDASLVCHDIRRGPLDGTFDLVVASEVLEHVEDPAGVLTSLLGLMGEGGRIFLNVPINSPSPDHIYLWRTPEEFFAFVRGCGVRPLSTYTFPMTGHSEQRARDEQLTISCVMIGEAAN
ncbi:class I SAM-dependent methyltransferase [Salinispora pacifica]|uniref:class I SAM-dependent methyltransferase n=1 Tax=Salinispora pacifica TaxID=351187 RepID=UPI00035E5AA5|nr:class I SAM-dependent methyltransferase [Salinispora pacifica]